MKSFFWKTSKILFWIVIFFIFIFCSSLAYVWFHRASEFNILNKNFVQISKKENSKICGVIFGAAVWKDKSPSHALGDRIIAGTELFRSKKIHCLILSGGPSAYGIHEVDLMAKELKKRGINTKFFLDYQGLNTQKTLQNLPSNIDYFVFISNDFHLGRIKILAKKLGIKNFQIHAANYHYGRYRKEFYFIFRESVGILYYFFSLDNFFPTTPKDRGKLSFIQVFFSS